MAGEQEAGGRAVAVLGYSRRRDAALHPICAGRLLRAQELAGDARVVMLSGWARRRRRAPEAELMRAAWEGPGVPLVCDPDARSTAENVANVVATARALGVSEVVVVTSRWHRLRVRILLRAALREPGIVRTVEGSAGPRPAGALVRELGCLLLLPLQLPRARRAGRIHPG